MDFWNVTALYGIILSKIDKIVFSFMYGDSVFEKARRNKY